MTPPPRPDTPIAERIRVRGAVQGVGFRPMVWRLANAHGLRGWVGNDGEGVVMLVGGTASAIEAFVGELPRHVPPLARIEAIEREAADPVPEADDAAFRIVASAGGAVRTGVVADAATCPECLAEIADPANRRFGYAFTNCTHCGPRLSIIEAIPYDRANTTMRDFALCPECGAEYADPGDRRFHAQPIACPVCGPRVWLESADDSAKAPPICSSHRRKPVPSSLVSMDSGFRRNDEPDGIDAAAALIASAQIIAIKGLGGFQLACDAGSEDAVARLRARKRRECKPFALMARDLDVVRRYCTVSETEAALLRSPAAPIVILETAGPERVAPGVAPGVATLGFMLPNTPLHHLLLRDHDRPIVLTSGNLSDEPQCIDNADARARLGGIDDRIADHFLMHDRGIARRVDDSVARVMAGEARVLRRARGYAPAPIRLPDGFSEAPPVLAMGGELKNTFCLLRSGEAILSHHIGDLADALCHADYAQSIDDYQRLFEHDARVVAVDRHPDYLSRKLGLDMATQRGVSCVEVQHHHAHVAACLAENGVTREAPPVLGIALDGLGFGDDGTLWGCEFLLADYRGYRRLGSLAATAMPGGTQAIHEPWRNTYAQLFAAADRDGMTARYGDLDVLRFLAGKPQALLDGMIAKGINSPRASSCGRLFDAVAAAAGVCRERACYEGQAAVEFEALADRAALADANIAPPYPFAIVRSGVDGLQRIDPAPMWQTLLDDLWRGAPVPEIAARFHAGMAAVLGRMAATLAGHDGHECAGRPFDTVALSGGVFQNRILLELTVARLERSGFKVLTHRRVPANDGGLALGQAVVAAAQADAG